MYFKKTANRSVDQEEANHMDWQLYNLQSRCDARHDHTTEGNKGLWDEVSLKLSQIRSTLQLMMHYNDIENT